MNGRLRTITTAMLITMFFAIPALGSSFADTYGFSAEGIARGNAMTAVVNDWSSVYYNIAGLGKTRDMMPAAPKSKKKDSDREYTSKYLKMRKRETGGGHNQDEEAGTSPNELSVSVLYTFPRMNISINRYDQTTGLPVPTRAADLNPYGYLVLGVALDLNLIIKMPRFISSARFGLGLGTNIDGTLVKVNDIDPRTHNFLLYGRDIQRALIITGFGFGFLNDTFGFGGGINASFSGEGRVTMEGNIPRYREKSRNS